MKVRYISVPGEKKAGGCLQKTASEDFYHFRLKDGLLTAAVGDWASNLMGQLFEDGETAGALGHAQGTIYNGGVIGAQTARKAVANSNSTGYELVGEINEAIARKYRELGLDASDPRNLFAGFMTHVSANSECMTITSIGDVYLYADGSQARHGELVIGEETKVQKLLNKLRRSYIRKTGDTEGAYDSLRQRIRDQQRFQNAPGHPLSYPAITGQPIKGEVKVLRTKTPKDILFFSDGYVPTDFLWTIESLEKLLAHVYDVDPCRYLEYPAVGSLLDDRTALQISLDDWSRLEEEAVKPSFFRKHF